MQSEWFDACIVISRMEHQSRPTCRGTLAPWSPSIIALVLLLPSACASRVSDGILAPKEYALFLSPPERRPFCSFDCPGVIALISQTEFPAETPTWLLDLRAHRGRVPLIRVSQRPPSALTSEPSFELTVFDDGFIVYVGRGCVKREGGASGRLSPHEVDTLRDWIAGTCPSAPTADDEICIERGTVHDVACSDGKRVLSATDRCRRDPTSDARVANFARDAVDRLGARTWIGDPLDWSACGPERAGGAGSGFIEPPSNANAAGLGLTTGHTRLY